MNAEDAAVLIIDGRSGSGKTCLARRIAAGSGAAILRLDDLYPGWGGLAAGAAAVPAALSSGAYRRYDWGLGEFVAEAGLEPGRPLVIEGCGSLTSATLVAAREFARSSPHGGVWSVWLECPVEIRRRRALDRTSDGGGAVLAPHWDDWAEQERRHFAAAQPIALANEIRHSEGAGEVALRHR